MKTRTALLILALILGTLFLVGGVSASENITDSGSQVLLGEADNSVVSGDDLDVSQNVYPSEIYMNERFQISIGVKNAGDQDLKDLNIVYQLPEGLDKIIWPSEYVGDQWTIDSLHPGETDYLNIVCVSHVSNTTLTSTVMFNGEILSQMNINILPSADLAVKEDHFVLDDVVLWEIFVENYGPDVALNTKVYNLPVSALINYFAEKGDLINGVWSIGDLAKGENATLIILNDLASFDDKIYNILVLSDTHDPDLNNNIASASLNYGNKAAAEKVIDSNATGNPIVALMLCLFAIPLIRMRRV